jgi:hypothetical protein
LWRGRSVGTPAAAEAGQRGWALWCKANKQILRLTLF